MELAITLPDDIARQLKTEWQDLPRRALEALAVEGYKSQALTWYQVGRLLGHASRWETDAFLKEHEAYLHYTVEDLEQDTRTFEKVLGERSLPPTPCASAPAPD
jgi:predicted HTH domain antitoxin